MLFFNPNAKVVKDRNFDCSKCKPEIQKARGCKIDSYNLSPHQARQVPIKILTHGALHKFCPSKLFRDNPETVLYFEVLYNHIKTGTSLEILGIQSTVDTLTDINTMIRLIESYTRMEQYEVLGNMLGGEQSSKES
jgi:hypothetical protein